ncbi:MAG: TonB-dependent receptor plug domain-containing protein, partial [Arcobacter sp.]
MQKNLSISLVASFFLATNLFSAQNLETITVTSATKSEQSIKDVTSNVDVITKEEIEERHFTTITEALNTLAGVNVINNGGLGTSSSVKLRGFDTKRVLVLIDGIRVNDVTGSSGAPFEHLMISNIERIEVVKGAQSGIWGADASAGVINIITSSAKKGFHGSVNAEYGSYDTKKIQTELSYKESNYYVKGSISSLDTNGFTAQAPKGTKNDYLEDDGYENITANIKFGYEFDDSNKIDLSHTLINARNEYDGCDNNKWKTSSYRCTDTAIEKANNDSYYSKTQDTFSSINFNHVNNFNQIDLYANRSVFDREYNNVQSYIGGVNDGKTLLNKSEFDGTLDEFGAKSTIPYLNDTSSLIVGGDYKLSEYKSDINKEYNNKALFVTNSNKFFDNTIFTQSLRADYYNKFEDKTTGKIGLKHFITNDFNVSSNYGTAYNVPTLYNLYSEYGNENINPEKTKSFD